jgi:hypothetical protein
MLSDGYADEEWAIKNNPIIVDTDKKDLLARIKKRIQEESDKTYPIENENDVGGDGLGQSAHRNG